MCFRARRRHVHARNSGGESEERVQKAGLNGTHARLDEARWLMEYGESVHVKANVLRIKDRIFQMTQEYTIRPRRASPWKCEIHPVKPERRSGQIKRRPDVTIRRSEVPTVDRTRLIGRPGDLHDSSSFGDRMKFTTLPLVSSSASVAAPLKAEPATMTMLGDASQHILQIGGGNIRIDIRQGSILQPDDVLGWVRRAADAVTVYYGVFPVRHARVVVIQNQGNGREIHGTTWGDTDGVQGLSKMRLGGGVAKVDLDSDWTMTHEFFHMASSSLPDESHWLEEGLATYVEPIARAQAGQLSAEQVWQDMVHGMPYGEPQPGDLGLNKTTHLGSYLLGRRHVLPDCRREDPGGNPE